MTRLTKEREAKIRESLAEVAFPHPVPELLAELDALREELAEALDDCDGLEIQRDEARSDLAIAVEALEKIGYTEEKQPIIGTSNRSARMNFELACRTAQKTIAKIKGAEK